MTEEGVKVIWKSSRRDTRCENGIAGKLKIERTGIGGCEKLRCVVRIAAVVIEDGVAMIIIHHPGDIGIAVAHPKNY